MIRLNAAKELTALAFRWRWWGWSKGKRELGAAAKAGGWKGDFIPSGPLSFQKTVTELRLCQSTKELLGEAEINKSKSLPLSSRRD